MEKVFPVESGVFPPSAKSDLGNGSRPSSAMGEGRIESIFGPGLFSVVLESGEKIRVRGPLMLQIGSKVQVFSVGEEKLKNSGSIKTGDFSSFASEGGFQWSALIPLGFGGKNAAARLEVFVENRIKGGWEKASPATYFVMTVQTQNQGEIQWSIYIKGRQVAIQVHAKENDEKKEHLEKLIDEIELMLKKRGFGIAAPTVILSKPFKVPTGFRLNLRG